MKKHLLLISLFVLASFFTVRQANSQLLCPNADFAFLNFTNWVGKTGSCCPLFVTNPGIVFGRHTIIAVQGQDANTGFQLDYIPPGYTQSCRLGNDQSGCQAESLEYTLTIDSSNALFIYNYAVVLYDPSHLPASQPRFDMVVLDSAGNSVSPCTYYHVVSGSNIPGFQNVGSVRWKDWTQIGVNLLPYIGQSITIKATTGDCGACGHYGYAYIAARCQPMLVDVTYCVGDTLAVLVAPDGFESYVWSTGDTTKTIIITSPSTNNDTIICTLTSASGCVANLQVELQPAVILPGFTTSSGCGGCVQFTDTTWLNYGYVDDWQWDFGDGDTAGIQHPNHCYTQSGTYNVNLSVVTNGGCVNDSTFQVIIPGLITPGFSINYDPCSLTQSFTDTSTISGNANIIAWLWDFGDGDTSTQQNPSHTFPQEGTYTIMLYTLSSDSCLDSASQTITIYSVPAPGFTATSECALSPVSFTDTTVNPSGPITNWIWSFGNGDSAFIQNPTYAFTNYGNHQITLIAIGPGGCTDTITQAIYTNPNPVADFSAPTVCGLTGTFIDSSIVATGSVNGWIWTFGDGDSAFVQNPTHTYPQPNTWQVQLIAVTDSGCTDTVVMPFTNLEIPVADFSATQECFDIPTQFTDQTTSQTDSIVAWSWDFITGNSNQQNPSFTFPADGNFNVTLIVTSDNGCADTVIKPVTVDPLPVVDFTFNEECTQDVVQFTDQSTIPVGSVTGFNWDLSNDTSNLQNPTNTYQTYGMYTIQLIATSNYGCIDSLTKQLHIHPRPEIVFSANPTEGCQPLLVTFTNSSTIPEGTINDYVWDFGDGGSSNLQNPVYLYQNFGSFDVTLTATSAFGCDTTVVKADYIKVYPKPKAVFGFIPDEVTSTDPVIQFNAISNLATQYFWDFGDGKNSNQEDPSHYYNVTTETGFLITLVIETAHGCRDTVSHEILVKPAITIYIPNAFTPNGDNINDLFKIYGSGIRQAEITIFNRWGETLYSMDKEEAMYKGWNGYVNTRKMMQGVYVYKARVLDIDGTWHSFYGKITLLR